MNDQISLGGVFRPGPYWTPNSARIARELSRSGLSDFRRNVKIGKGFVDVRISNPFDLLDPKSKTKRLYDLLNRLWPFRRVLDHYQNFIDKSLEMHAAVVSKNLLLTHGYLLQKYENLFAQLDTMRGQPADSLDWRNVQISHAYLSHLNRIENFSHVVDFSNKRMLLEIGGGFGVNAHLFSELFTNIRKILYVDIPPMLYVGTQYLKCVLPNEVYDYLDFTKEKPTSIKAIRERIVCLPPWVLPAIDFEWDLFWNSASFQEMSVGQIKYYMENLTERQCREAHEMLLIFYTAENTSLRVEEFEAASNLQLVPVEQKHNPAPGFRYFTARLP